MELVYQDSGVYVCTVGNGILGTNGREKQTGYGFVKIQGNSILSLIKHTLSYDLIY